MNRLLYIFLLIASFLFTAVMQSEDAEKSDDVLSWDVLKKVEAIEKDFVLVPKFSAEVAALNGTEVKLRGYIMPLEEAKEQKHFVLSANPVAGCYFCVPGGPETMVEVMAEKKVKFGYNPIVISGVLELLEDDPMGMYYRMKNAKVEAD